MTSVTSSLILLLSRSSSTLQLPSSPPFSGTGTTTQDSYDLVLKTGAWGRDIFVPGVIAGLVADAAGVDVVAGLEIFIAYSFETTFWNWLNGKIEEIGGEKRPSLCLGPFKVYHFQI